MSLDSTAKPFTNIGSPLMETSSAIKMDKKMEDATKMEVDGAEVRMEKETETSVKDEQNSMNPGRSPGATTANIIEDGTVITTQGDQPLVTEMKPDLPIPLENGAHDDQKSNLLSVMVEETTGEIETTIPLNDGPSLPSNSSTFIGSSTTSHAIAKTAPEAPPQSPLRSIQAQPVPFSKSEVPSLLLRMGPPVTDSNTPTSPALSIVTPASPSKVLPQRPLPDRSLMDRPLMDKPVIDTWLADGVVRTHPARSVTDTYIAPRSPPLGGSSATVNPSNKRRLERSPPRTRYEGEREKYQRDSRTEDGPYRENTRRNSWRDEHVLFKRYKVEAQDHMERLPNKRYEAEKEVYTESGHVPRGDSWRPRDGDRTEHPRTNGRTHHDDNRSRHKRSPSVERRSDWGARGASDGTREQWADRKRSPDVERKSDWGTRGMSDRERDLRGDGDRDDHRHRNSARETNGHRDARDRPGELSTRTMRDEEGRRSVRDDDDYNRKSDGYSRTREYVEVAKRTAQRQPTRQSQPDRRTADTADHPPRSAGIESSGWDRSSGKRHEGRQAESIRSSHRSPPPRQNGREAVSVNATNGTTHATQQSTNQTGWERTTVNAAQSPPPKEQRQTPTGPKPRSHQQPALSQKPLGYGNAPQSSTATTAGWPRTATNGANSEPVNTRRGYEPPKAAPRTGPSHSTFTFTQHVPKDTLTPPLQDKEYILAKYAAQKHLVKSVWIDNSKAPVANFLTGGKGGANGLGPRGPAYRVAMGRLGGVNIARATLPIRGHPSIIGTGDDPLRVQAEKLACLSALFQLAEAGLVKCEEQPVEEPLVETMDIDDADSEEVTQLSTGETITLREARAFMDYYCKRFGFGQPVISYETVAMRTGPQKWEAIMEVGGKKIGLGAGTTKKMATRVCYLDVTSYLEKCDQELWKEYVEHAKGQAIQG
ncbi:hypothetical protein QFC21_002888 [Naganishia friedmannii]|uniref:Uncharacterized protein n=1 Tax=Naganishia friedmannii TaxID=89922 RepID=A0ACC2VSV4_9TREE|nr:hypothetical protein QFC21_002888 [Naganishia friedmannii]